MKSLWLTLLALAALSACEDKQFGEPMTLGGKLVPAEALNRGFASYRRNCTGCHGKQGDGDAPTAKSMKPRPRDFTLGYFKFKSVPGDGLPTDEDLLQTVRRGLRGTHMPSWANLPDADLLATLQYIKTFSPRWGEHKVGQPVPHPSDPWTGNRLEAVKRGEVVYHATAGCWECHPAYVPRSQLVALRAQEKIEKPPLRDHLQRSRPVKTRYGPLTAPDYLSDPLKVAWEPALLYRTVAAGVGGTPMPSWHGRLAPRDLWAVVHYIQHLIQIKGTPEAKTLREQMIGP